MTLYYHPSFTSQVYIDYTKHNGLLFNAECVSTAGLLEQLLLRAGLPQSVVEDNTTTIEQREQTYLQIMDAEWIDESKQIDPKGTVEQILLWRDALLMEGWKPEMTAAAQSDKLSSLSAWEKAYAPHLLPARADRWVQLACHLQAGNAVFQSDDHILVMTPKKLLPNLVVKVLDLLKATYLMENLDSSILHPESIRVIKVTELYEAWLQVHNFAGTTDVFVCADTNRLNDTMYGIGGAEWQTTHAGCVQAVCTMTDILDTPNSMVWLDCAGNPNSRYRFDWLTQAEIAELTRAGIPITDAETLASTSLRESFTLLNRISNITLIAPKMHEGELLGEHPVVTTWKQIVKAKNDDIPSAPQLPQTSKQETISFVPQAYIHLNHPEKLPQTNDSFSSLETMFQSPFDFIMSNKLELYPPENEIEDNIKTIMGNVGHLIVQKMIGGETFDHALNSAMQEKGQILSLPENYNAMVLFQKTIKDSVDTLFRIIRDLNLTPFAAEYKITQPFDIFTQPSGFIDLVLKTFDNQLVIFDLKYSERSVYADSLVNNTSVQLEFYRHALEAAEQLPVAWTAYYLFPLQTLYTTHPLTGENIVVVEPAQEAVTDLWSVIKSTYTAREKEWKSGQIEEGEGFSLENLDFTHQENVLPLATAFHQVDHKAVGFSNYRTDDENLLVQPTKHTILKNHLK